MIHPFYYFITDGTRIVSAPYRLWCSDFENDIVSISAKNWEWREIAFSLSRH